MTLAEYNTLRADLADYERMARNATKSGLVAHSNTYAMISILRKKLSAIEGHKQTEEVKV